MSDQFRVALIRALIGGTVQAGVVFFATLAAAAGSGPVSKTALVVAGIGAGSAFFGTLAIRFGAEGLIDTKSANASAMP